MTLHEAIFKLNPTVVIIRGDVAYDSNNHIVEYDKSLAQQMVIDNEYKEKREMEYPSIVEQLDTLYHGGLAEWKATIKAVKDKYPKPE